MPLFFGAGSGPHRKIRYCCYGTTHSVGLDNTGKRTRSVQNRNAAEALTFPREVQRQLHIWKIVRCIWKIGGDCNLLEWQEVCRETRALRLTVEIHIWDPNGHYIWNPTLPVLRDSSSEGLAPDAPPRPAAEGMEELDRVYSGLSGAVFSKPTQNRGPSVLLPV